MSRLTKAARERIAARAMRTNKRLMETEQRLAPRALHSSERFECVTRALAFEFNYRLAKKEFVR